MANEIGALQNASDNSAPGRLLGRLGWRDNEKRMRLRESAPPNLRRSLRLMSGESAEVNSVVPACTLHYVAHDTGSDSADIECRV